MQLCVLCLMCRSALGLSLGLDHLHQQLLRVCIGVTDAISDKEVSTAKFVKLQLAQHTFWE